MTKEILLASVPPYVGEEKLKRSEMLSLIKGILEVGRDFDFDYQAENLLANIEQSEMKPPTYLKKQHEYIDDEGQNQIIDIFSDNWEPEE